MTSVDGFDMRQPAAKTSVAAILKPRPTIGADGIWLLGIMWPSGEQPKTRAWGLQ